MNSLYRLPAVDASAPPDAPSPNWQPHVASVTLRILVVDDNVDSAEMLRSMLELCGHEVRTAFNGAVGLEMALEFQPQVILCDIGLPGMSGYDLAAKLRDKPEFRKTRLIALSGYGQEQDRLRSKEAGFDYHLTKPVEPQMLTDLLASL